jgi:hypothetical protein
MLGLLQDQKVGPLRGYLVTWKEGYRLGASSLPLLVSRG